MLSGALALAAKCASDHHDGEVKVLVIDMAVDPGPRSRDARNVAARLSTNRDTGTSG